MDGVWIIVLTNYKGVTKIIYFTSDLHFEHANIIKICNRPFNSVQEMNEAIVNNWNSVVKANDIVYILGDVMMNKDVNAVKKYIDRLNGSKVLIVGNHDYFKKRYLAAGYDFFLYIKSYEELEYNKQRFILMHYPIMDWNHMFRGSYMLHGHMHNKAVYNYQNRQNGVKRYDVGVDANNFAPVSIDDIIGYFK